MPQTAALDPALLMYIRYVYTHASVLSECTDRDRCVTPCICSHSLVCKKSDEETSDGLDGQDASRPLSVDGEAVPGHDRTSLVCVLLSTSALALAKAEW